MILATREDALEYVLPFGARNGKSFRQLTQSRFGLQYLLWLESRKKWVPKDCRKALGMVLEDPEIRRKAEEAREYYQKVILVGGRPK